VPLYVKKQNQKNLALNSRTKLQNTPFIKEENPIPGGRFCDAAPRVGVKRGSAGQMHSLLTRESLPAERTQFQEANSMMQPQGLVSREVQLVKFTAY
jgi:hypothetical protein